MPHLEAPIAFEDSSPDGSISPLPAGPDVTVNAVNNSQLQTAHGRHSVIHIRVQRPEQQQHHPQEEQNAARRNNRFSQAQSDSFDRDMPINEEDNHWPPAAVHLLPVTFPPPQAAEPTLDELLQRVTERNDLQNVESIRLRVISYTISLSRLSLFLPRLQQLDLSGSVLGSLRDLGFGLIHLSYINVSNCGLNSFDGTSGLPAICEMVADGNMIQRVGPLSELPLLQRLSAQNNRISDLGLLSFLGMCPNLTELQLQGNPVCHLNLYQTTLERSIPTLLLLDGLPLHNPLSVQQRTAYQNSNNPINNNNYNNFTTSADDESDLSSLSSERQTNQHTISSISSEAETVGTKQLSRTSVNLTGRRPATAPNEVRNPRPLTINRPASVTEHSSTRAGTLTQGALMVGSVLNLARRSRRRRNFMAWTSNNSSSNSTSISELDGVFTATDQTPITGTCISNCSSPEPSSSSGIS